MRISLAFFWCSVVVWLSPAAAEFIVNKIIRPVSDWALCNNGLEEHHVLDNDHFKCLSEDRKERIPCDSRNLGESSEFASGKYDGESLLPKGCFEMLVFISYSPRHSLKEVFSSPIFHPQESQKSTSKKTDPLQSILNEIDQIFNRSDQDYHLRRIRFIYPSHDYELFSQLIDTLLTPRIWLQIRKETFPFPFSSQSMQFHKYLDKQFASIGVNAANLKPASFLTMIIDKYHHDVEPYFRYLATIQYPDSDTCLNKAGLMISRHFCTHPGWAGVIGMYKYQQQIFQHANMAVYVSSANRPDEITAFEGGMGSDCSLINRWHCSFLPSSTCLFPNPRTGASAMPENITDCHQESCVSQIPETHFFMTMSIQKVIPPAGQHEVIHQLSRQFANPVSTQQQLWFWIIRNQFDELRKFFSDKNNSHIDVDMLWKSQPIWTPASSAASSTPAKDKTSTNGSGSFPWESQMDMFPGLSGPAHFNRWKYIAPSTAAPFVKWPYNPKTAKEGHYEMTDFSIQDIVMQNAYLLRHNYKYRAYIAHALHHFLDLHALQDEVDHKQKPVKASSSSAKQQATSKKADFDIDHAQAAHGISPEEDATIVQILLSTIESHKNPAPAKMPMNHRSTFPTTVYTGHSHTKVTTKPKSSPIRNTAEKIPRCVAVQIRRGDRIMSDLDNKKEQYSAYCKENPEGDYGCRTVPFAFISLLNVTEVAPLLVHNPTEVQHLVVSTDDEGWLQEQIALLQRWAPQWQVHFLPAPWLSHFNVTDLQSLHSSDFSDTLGSHAHYGGAKNHSRAHQLHHHALSVNKTEAEAKFKAFGRSGLTGGIHFFASMAMLQQCEAFIGHFDSGVAWLMYAAMCHRHHGRVGMCPPMFDLRKLSEFHQTYGYQYS